MLSTTSLVLKDGPLANVWHVAHSSKDASAGITKKSGLSRQEIEQTNIPQAVTVIRDASQAKSKSYLNLRYTSHLLLGIAKIYSLNARYLLEDCNQALTKVRVLEKIEQPGAQTRFQTVEIRAPKEALALVERGLAALQRPEEFVQRQPLKNNQSITLPDALFYQSLLKDTNNVRFHQGANFVDDLLNEFHQARHEQDDFDFDFGFDLVAVPKRRGELDPEPEAREAASQRPEPSTPPRKQHFEVEFEGFMDMDFERPKTPVRVEGGLPTPVTKRVERIVNKIPFEPLSPTTPKRSLSARELALQDNAKAIQQFQEKVIPDDDLPDIAALYNPTIDAMLKQRPKPLSQSTRIKVLPPYDAKIQLSISEVKAWWSDSQEEESWTSMSNYYLPNGNRHERALQTMATLVGPEWVFPSRFEDTQVSPKDVHFLMNHAKVPIFNFFESLPQEFDVLNQPARYERIAPRPIVTGDRLLHDMVGGDEAVLLDEPKVKPLEILQRKPSLPAFDDFMDLDVPEPRGREEVRSDEVLTENKRRRSPTPIPEPVHLDTTIYNWNRFLPKGSSQGREISFKESLPCHQVPREAVAKMFHDLLVFATQKKLVISQPEAYGDVFIHRNSIHEELVAPPSEDEEQSQPSRPSTEEVQDSDEPKPAPKKRKGKARQSR